jgi:hypothetical protein
MTIKGLIDDIKEAKECVHDVGATPVADIITTCDQADMCLQDALIRLESLDGVPTRRFDDWLLIINESYSDYDVEDHAAFTLAQFLDVLINHFSIPPPSEQPDSPPYYECPSCEFRDRAQPARCPCCGTPGDSFEFEE